jgi:hypothetical protein
MSPSKILRDLINKKMEQARLALRRRKNIRPMLDKWDLFDFNELVKVLQSPECPTSDAEKGQCERKFMARWRIKLTQLQRENRENRTDRDVMTEYIGRHAEDYGDQQFEALMAYLHLFIDKLHLNETGKRRRAIWELFSAMDQRYTGSLLYELMIKFLQRNTSERFHNKAFQKLCTKWAAQVKKNNIDKLEMNIEQFQGFMAELLHDMPYSEFESTVSHWTRLKLEIDT